jgi:general secretion pathway protein G
MRTHRTHRLSRAFTLIEILIVVVILGILAAIVIPQFTDASQEAQEASVHSMLQTIRSQIELYNVQNPGTPFDGTTWGPLVTGNYLQDYPRNPLSNNATNIAVAAAAGNGWCFQPNGAGDTWSITVRPVSSAGAVLYVDTNGNPY